MCIKLEGKSHNYKFNCNFGRMKLFRSPRTIYYWLRSKIRSFFQRRNLKRKGVEFTSFSISGTPFIEKANKSNRIVLGHNIRMNNGTKGNLIGYTTPCVLRSDNGDIIIGDNVGMSQTVIVAKGANVTIGNYTLLGGGVKIYSSDFHSLDYKCRRNIYLDVHDRKSAPVSIGSDCFIGAGSIILKGVTIGDRAIIGAGSVVLHNIPSDCVAAGNPAKIIRSNSDN